MKTERRGFTLVELLVVIAIIAILVAILLPAINAVREAARRTNCQTNIKQAGLAMLTYSEQYRRLPYGAQFGNNATTITTKIGTTGWVALLPYVEETAAFKAYKFTVPSGSVPYMYADNFPTLTTIVPVFQCPSDDALGEYFYYRDQGKFSRSNFAFCFGSNTFGISNNSYETNGSYRADGSRRLTDLEDGTSKTALAAEVLKGMVDTYDGTLADSRGVWGWPFAGGSAYTHLYLPNSVEGDLLRGGYCADNRPKRPCDSSGTSNHWQQYASARSNHSGGVNVVFGDNHTTFVTDTIDLVIWQAIATMNNAGNEPSFNLE